MMHGYGAMGCDEMGMMAAMMLDRVQTGPPWRTL